MIDCVFDGDVAMVKMTFILLIDFRSALAPSFS